MIGAESWQERRSSGCIVAGTATILQAKVGNTESQAKAFFWDS